MFKLQPINFHAVIKPLYNMFPNISDYFICPTCLQHFLNNPTRTSQVVIDLAILGAIQ